MDYQNQTVTITFCDQAENHVRMQKIGNMSMNGFGLEDLMRMRNSFKDYDLETQLIDLNYPLDDLDLYPDDEAYILIIRKGIDYILGPNDNADDFFNEQIELDWDKKALMYGRVVNKNARHNLCFGQNEQDADYEMGNGTVISFDTVPFLEKTRIFLSGIIGDKFGDLVAEGNYYYDITKCGIGFHGDSERKIVIGVRLGDTIPLDYQWFIDSKPIGERISLNLHHGDIYFMSEKATGNDWKRKTIYTLRHAAGAEKYLKN